VSYGPIHLGATFLGGGFGLGHLSLAFDVEAIDADAYPSGVRLALPPSSHWSCGDQQDVWHRQEKRAGEI
jgi:hypothetical protein